MEQNRTLLILLLAFISYLMWDAWQKDYGPKPVVATQSAGQSAVPVPGAASSTNTMPVPTPATSSTGNTVTAQALPTPTSVVQTGQRLKIETDVYRAEIDTLGGDLSQVDLIRYPVHFKKKDEPFRLMDASAQRFFVAQSGWYLPEDPENKIVPGSRTLYSTSQSQYRLNENQNNLIVDLSWKNPQGLQFIKRYTFHRNSYIIDVNHLVSNPRGAEFKANLYLRMQRNSPLETNSLFMLPTYVGPVYYSPDQKYRKVHFSDIDDIKNSTIKDVIARDISGGWAAIIEQFFVGAWLPDGKETFRYFTSKTDDANNRYMIGMVGEKIIGPGAQNSEHLARLYVGPKLQNELETIAPGLELSIDYGWLTFLAKPLFWALDHINNLVHNWGWSIILLTILIKLVFYKLSEASYRSMAKMKAVAPRMMALKERYADDKQRMNQALMELYKTEKINPLGGCLPILIQIPVFIALYYVLIESVELRQAPWILWIEDLSIMDPYFVLPIIMGVTMLIQHKLNPAPLDPLQAKIMMILPIMFTVMFAVFPAGLVLYWVVNNVLSIAQQWYITKHVVTEEKQSHGHHAQRNKDD